MLFLRLLLSNIFFIFFDIDIVYLNKSQETILFFRELILRLHSRRISYILRLQTETERRRAILESVENLAFLDIDHLLPSPLCLMDFGIERRENKNYDYDNSDRGYYIGYLFQFTLGGCGMFEAGGTQTVLDKGKCFFLPFPHKSRYHIIENEYWKFCYVHFHGTVADQFYEEIVRKAGGNLFSLSNTGETVPYLLKEIESVRMGKTYQRYEAGSFLYQFLCSLLREVEEQTMPAKNCAVRGHEWLERNFTSDRSLSEMCEELHVSLSHFSRQFRDVYGTTPMKYLTHLRLEFSRQLLLNTTLNIQEISRRSGFGNGNYFTKVFRKAVGMPPSQYRALHGILL